MDPIVESVKQRELGNEDLKQGPKILAAAPSSIRSPALHDRYLEQLSAAAAKFSLQLDLQRLMSDVALESARVLSAEQVIVYTMDDNRLSRVAWFPESQTDWPEIDPLPLEALRAVRHLEPVLTHPEAVHAPSSRRNAIYIPLVGTQNRMLGLIEFRKKRHGAFFHQQDLRLAICMGRIATSAVDRARLFGRIEEWSQSIETLLSFNAAVNRHLKPQELVRQLVMNASGFIDADGGAAGIAVSIDSVAGMECEGFYFDQAWYPFTRRWESNQGIPGTVLQTEFPMLINDYPSHPLADAELNSKFELGSCICVAIKNPSEQVLGFFKLHRRFGKPAFTWQDAALLESLGNTAAVAIENARLVKSLELKNEQVKNLSAAHVRRLEQERQHIARELHDETGQVLIGLKLNLQVLSRSLHPTQLEAKKTLEGMQEQLGDAALRLRELAKRLRPPTLDELGFEATIRQLLSEYRKKVQFDIFFEANAQCEFSNEAETALYRIVQESLTNIAKHAAASRVEIRIDDDLDYPILSISDDGCGFDVEQVTSGLGLVGIRERAKMLGAQVAIRSSKGKGTQIEISRIPLK